MQWNIPLWKFLLGRSLQLLRRATHLCSLCRPIDSLPGATDVHQTRAKNGMSLGCSACDDHA